MTPNAGVLAEPRDSRPPAVVRPLLRDATRDLHERLDELVSRRLLGPEFRRETYLRLLHRLRSFFIVWEPRTNRVLADILPGLVPSRGKVGMLNRDIASLCGATFDPPPVFVPDVENSAAALGAMYVIEGSTLGGRVIAPQIAGALRREGVTDGGTRYFESYGAQVPGQWGRFLAVLEQTVAPEQHGCAVAAAVAMFRAVERMYESV